MLLSSSLQLLSIALYLAAGTDARPTAQGLASNVDTGLLHARQQDIVTWDDHSLAINGQRLMVFSGEVHPFRIPVPSLWFDLFQKMKAAGYNCVSTYVDWMLLEGKRGEFRAEGIFSLETYFEAAQKAGLYVIVRPGPFINGEVSGGGFPGWLTRVPSPLRTKTEAYMSATDLYTSEIGKIVAAAQITNGGPVILFQPENEYQLAAGGFAMPDFDYWTAVTKQYQDAGVVVPYINNETPMKGYVSTSTPSKVDIYGFDAYPLGFDCANPTYWPQDALPTYMREVNNNIAPDAPLTIPEFQGGAFQLWGQGGFDNCALLLNMEFERVLYKNNYAAGATIFNIYMTYGGTNWGNLGHVDGYTSYDYGAPITEERLLWREKYSEIKLQANFFHVSPAFLAADRFDPSLDFTDNGAVTVTLASTDASRFYISRHTTYDILDSTQYRLRVSTVGYGDIVIPQLGDTPLVLNGRDSKIHVSDYPVGDERLIYSSAEVFTWKRYEDRTILVLYSGPNEHHEIAVESREGLISEGEILRGLAVNIQQAVSGYTIISWDMSDNVEDRKVVRVNGNFYIYLLNRNEAYNFWVPPTGSDYGTSDIIMKAGYLIRSVQRDGGTINLVGDVNATTPIEIIGGAPLGLTTLTFNGEPLVFEQSPLGVVTATVGFQAPEVTLPPFSEMRWKKIDSLPELSADYDDSAWVDADLKESPSGYRAITTPMSLYATDYGFSAGSVLYRGHFTANGKESTLYLWLQGGTSCGFSVFVDSAFLGSFLGSGGQPGGDLNLQLPSDWEAGSDHVFTIVMDHMGLNSNYVVGDDTLKAPRGITDYTLEGHDLDAVKWKITGNLGGEDYVDLDRGPLNEGGMFAERQGYHQPSPPSEDWEDGQPTEAISKPGITFYTTTFDLDLPRGYDIPLAIKFGTDISAGIYRAQLFVNGYQFGKFVPHIGPQARFPIPPGILDYHGSNTVGITVWAMEEAGAKIEDISWDFSMITATGFGEVEMAPIPAWRQRDGAY
ncbi:beta-galactosidase [Stachybotrys elegans]|uniref:Beta-galactosidase n=1 Tax=Stachybotrys elegans TaxID=80388 RepID=A0A8K0WLT6_9HYPO|nr:beta-galactosidase [Stachybotrys elegans]